MNDTSRSPGTGRLAPLVILLILAAIFRLPALKAPFSGGDLVLIDQVSYRSLPAAWNSPDPQADAFRPVGRQLLFWLVAHPGKASPRAAHAINLTLFLLSLGLLGWIARRLVGPYAATIAVALVGLSYAADIPLLWASGGQYLVGLAGALASIALYMAGARYAAAVALFIALLSNEAVLLAPVVAIAATPHTREVRRDASRSDPTRGPWPLLVAVSAWAALWFTALLRHEVSLRGVRGLRWDGVFAAFAHLGQVIVGFEWNALAGPGLHVGTRAMVMVALATLAVAWASRRRRYTRSASSSRAERTGLRGIGVGLLWAVAGALPLAASATTWSAHEYLFALCGGAMLVGAWAASQARWLGPILIGVLGVCSQNTSGLESFAAGKDAWSTESHFNRTALLADTQPVAQYAAELRRVRPRLAPKSTLFVSDMPGFWEAGGERLVRCAYRDSSLRAYDLGQFTLERARRGPAIFLGLADDRLRELAPEELRGWALGALRGGNTDVAYDALVYTSEARPNDFLTRYWVAWVAWSRGDTSTALDQLQRLGMRTKPGQPYKWDDSWAQKCLAAGDTVRSIELLTHVVRRQALDPWPHRRLASIARWRTASEPLAEVEAYAAQVLLRRPPDRPRGPEPVTELH